LTRYIYSNHLQSASLELDEFAEIISYEEYHPYGTTAYQAKSSTINAVAKRYRYTGKERDEESGLYYHGARYYVPWLCRSCASDPLESKYAGWSPYHYVKCNRVMDTDSTGMGGDKDGRVDVQFGDHTYNVESNYFPSGSITKLDEFGYKWQADGQTVVNYQDSSGKKYSVLEQRAEGSFNGTNY